MKLEKRILIIDDRPIFIQNIRFILNRYFKKKYNFQFYIIPEYINALDIIKTKSEDYRNIDIILLNIDINYRNYYGLVLVKKYISKIKFYLPFIKILISTSRNENYRINQIITNNKPHGIIVENIISEADIFKMFVNVFKSEAYYPKNIQKIIDFYRSSFDEINEVEFHILYLLKHGIKTNFFQFYIPRSSSTIEKVKSNLKDKLLLKNRSDDELIKEAIKRGFLNKFEHCKNYLF